MVINENNSQINAFVKGMNSDTAYDHLDNLQYVYAENVRITKNDSINNSSTNNFSSVHEGAVTPVPKGVSEEHKVVSEEHKGVDGDFLGSDSIGDIAVVITKYNNELRVYRAKINNNPGINEDTGQPNPYTSGFTLWWYCDIQDVEAVSTVAYQELEGVIKLYIATGVYPIIEIRIDDKTGPYSGKQKVDRFINNRILPIYPVYIENKIDGSLKTSQVQYTYRYYNKFGTTTQLAPLTNKIQVIDSNRAKETGNAQDTTTSVGFTLKIRNTNDYPAYNRLLIYRLSYIVPGEDANVALIYDGDVDTKTEGVTSFSFNDVGTTPLQELTMQEFAAMSGMIIIPKVIELNLQYMFAANIKDDTIIQNVTYSEENILTTLTKVTISDSLDGVPTHSKSNFSDAAVTKYLQDRNVNPGIVENSYNNIFTSSLLRSLRRGEDYVYGIVYYDKYGRHTNVHEITGWTPSTFNGTTIRIENEAPGVAVPEISDDKPTFLIENQRLVANVYGVNITLPQPDIDDIIGCLIVRRSSKSIYQKTLLLVALARPVKLSLYNTQIQNRDNVIYNHDVPDGVKKDSPYYPSGFLWSDDVSIGPGMYFTSSGSDPDSIYKPDYDFITNTKTLRQARNRFIAHSFDNINLFLIFSSEIDFRRDDVLSVLKQNTLILSKLYACSISSDGDSSSAYNTSISSLLDGIQTHFEPDLLSGSANSADYAFDVPGFVDGGHIYRWSILLTADSKTNQKLVFPLYHITEFSDGEEYNVKSIKDIKLPLWFDGFSNLQLDGATVSSGGIKKYKQFETNIDLFVFNNWISFALYDNKISYDDNQPNAEDMSSALFLSGNTTPYEDGAYIKNRNSDFFHGHTTDVGFGERRGWIGPGTSCFVMTVDNSNQDALKSNYKTGCLTAICNIQHQISTVLNEPDEFILYFGFGNFFKLEGSAGNYKVVHNYTYNGQPVKDTTMTVFDGDIYITPLEISTMYKTYDFMSYDTLQSMQTTNYVPMESKVNTFFDYGMNLMNTNSANLMTEPGSIDGVTTQDRPVHQYNLIYSANDESNDVFTLVVEKAEDNNFKQRTYYSEPKTNGEYVDNFVIFKPAAYIDVDPKYGEVTNLLTDKNTLYYWQDTAFGKFSVNERSLINDTNGNTIMLGQAGILSRNDYISTKYGMRPYDYCATCAENGVYWVDVNNRAVVGGNSNECVNLGETLNVLNIINAKISEKVPRVDYDLQNNELLCKCFNDGELIVFNLKHKMATSVYNRNYEDIISIQNHIYGYIHVDSKNINVDSKDVITRYNYLKSDTEFMSPMLIDFVVNHASSTTKVFDSQQLVPMKRKGWLSTNREDETTYFEDSLGTNGSLSFETDINSTTNTIRPYTDREGNIIYNIPRFGNGDWGNRLRGKWMRVNMNYNTPTEYTTISHVITKFRQSYS